MASQASRRALAERLEREIVEAPVRYRVKLALLAVLGYAVLLGTLVLSVGLLLGMVGYLLIAQPDFAPNIFIPMLLLALVGAVTFRATWIRFTLPSGHRLQPTEAPALQAEVERIRRAMGARPLHGIVINADLNAAALVEPDGFALRGRRHVLMLGLPLLEALDREELATVIAHEFGHFSGTDEKFSAWIYGLRVRWYRLLEGIRGQGSGLWLWMFFRWYAPYFEAYSLALARRQEYRADAVAAEACGPLDTAGALVRIGRVGDWLEGVYWPGVMALAREQAYPPIEAFKRMAERLPVEVEDSAPLPMRLLDHVDDQADTHPSLRKRLAALGFDAPPAHSGIRVPASALLGELGDTLRQRFAQEWRGACQDEWQLHHHRSRMERERLDELDAHAIRTPEEQLQWACLTEDYRPNTDALPLYQAALRAAPSSALGHFRMGRLLASRGALAEAVHHLERSMTLQPEFTEPALRCLEAQLAGEDADSPLLARVAAMQRQHIEHEAVAEGAADVDLLPHGLEPPSLRDLARVLRGYGKVRAAWVVRKPGHGEEVLPHYLVLLDWTGSVASETAALPRLLPQLPLPGSCTLVTAITDPAQAQRIKRGGGDPAYRRP